MTTNGIESDFFQIRAINLITTGRTGTDFFQSLLDGHKSISTLNGHVFIYESIKRLKCLKGIDEATFSSDIFEEFFWDNIEKFKSRYDLIENKHALGENKDQSININSIDFVENCMNLVGGKKFSSKYFVLAIHYSYSKCLGEDVGLKKILFHHYHHSGRLPPFLSDFPDTLLVVMTRDPRANFCSSVYNWMEYRRSNFKGVREFTSWFRDGLRVLSRIFTDYRSVAHFKKNTMVIKLEDLGNEKILRGFCSSVGIEYSESMSRSTWGGLLWNNADKVSSNKKCFNTKGFDAKLIKNNWQLRLWWTEKYVFNVLLNTRLKEYRYDHTQCSIFSYFICFFLILIPFRYEAIALSFNSLKETYQFSRKELVKIPIYYMQRVWMCYKYLYREILGLDKGKFEAVLLK